MTGTGPVPMASRARKQAQHALSILCMALRQPPGVNPQQLRFVLGTGHFFGGSGRTGGWQAKDDIGYPIDLPADLTHYLAVPAMTLPVTASKGSIDEKALLAMNWLDRADFTPDLPLTHRVSRPWTAGQVNRRAKRKAAYKREIRHFGPAVSVLKCRSGDGGGPWASAPACLATRVALSDRRFRRVGPGMTESVAFGAWLRSCRRSAGLSQEVLAERAGLSVRAVRDLERGRTGAPHPGSLHRLADALALQGRARAEFLELGQGPAGPAANSAPPRGHVPPADSALVVPRQLPASVRKFVGRERELATLAGLAGQAGSTTEAVVISAIDGTAGIGKTALAVHFGHQSAGLFPDGQLYVNLAGFAPSGSPLAPGQAMRGFLRALGVRPQQIPPGLDGQAGLYRSLLAGQRMLVVLDNAADEQQVRPLLPGSPGCLAVVTSRAAGGAGGHGGGCADHPGLSAGG